MVFRLERVEQCDNEGMITGSEDLLFCKRTLDLVPLDHFLLTEN